MDTDTCPPHHWLITIGASGHNVGACLKCGDPMPAEKGTNRDRFGAASRKAAENGRGRGRALTFGKVMKEAK